MVYRFLLLSDEIDNFERIIEINSDATFYICSEDWEKEQEILQMEMDSDSSVDTYLMDSTHIDEFIEDKGQRLMFVFDMLTDRAFFIELKDIELNKTLKKPVCTVSKGTPPEQTVQFDEILDDMVKKSNSANIFDEDLYGDNMYNEDEFDPDGFSDVSFDEN